LKKQTQIIRTEFSVLRIAERKKAKMSINLEFIDYFLVASVPLLLCAFASLTLFEKTNPMIK